MLWLPIAVLSLPTIIYILAAIVPAILLMSYIYRKDTIEKEPVQLLWRLVLMGCLAGIVAMILEMIGQRILDSRVSQDDSRYIYYMAFCVVAMAEEGAKMFLMKKVTWNDPNFNYKFDGIVYAAFTSLGFAAFENIGYIFSYGLSIALSRAIFAIPGHLGFSVFMGIFYGLARKCKNRGDNIGSSSFLVLSYVFPVLLHGFYDSCCMSGTTESSLVFFAFVAVMYIIVINVVKLESRNDERI